MPGQQIIQDSSPDGERFLDTTKKPIPPRDTWAELSVVELYELQSNLQDKLWTFQTNPVMSRSLKEGLLILQAQIASRVSS